MSRETGGAPGVAAAGVRAGSAGRDLADARRRGPAWRTALFVALLVAVLAANAAIVAPEFWLTRLWEDEAYNLTVPLNLLAGHGYAGDGILTPGGTLTLFDPRISTGPVVLLPVTAMLATGVDLVVGARAVMLLFYAALLVGLWFAGRRIAGRWGGLAAIAVPLTLNLNQLPSPVQGPVDVLGEIPAAAALVFAFLFVQRRPWLGGLMLGLAVQIKLISGLAAPVLLVMVLVGMPAGTAWRARIRRAWPLVIWAVAPTVLYELVRLVTLVIAEGVGGYIHNTLVYGYFVLTGGQFGFHVSPAAKVDSLLGSWFVPVPVVAVLVVAALAVAVLAWLRLRMLARPGSRAAAERVESILVAAGARVPARELAIFLGGVALTLVFWCAWWTVSSHTPDWIRYMVTGFFLGVPVMAAALVLAVRILWVTRLGAPVAVMRRAGGSDAAGIRIAAAPAHPPRPIGATLAMTLAILTAAFGAGTWGVQAVSHIRAAHVPNYDETLAQQRAAAASIRELGEPVLVTRWGGQIGVIVLSGARAEAPVAAQGGDAPWIFSRLKRTDAGVAALDKQLHRDCGRVILELHDYVVCSPKH